MADFSPSAVSKSSNFVTGASGDMTKDVLSDLLANRTETYGLITSVAEQFYSDTAPSNPNTGMVWYDSASSVLKRWSGSAWVVESAEATIIAERNVVIQGNVDSNGNPALFTGSGSALTAQLNATTTPLIITWMDGNDSSNGLKNKIGEINSDSATFWSSLPTNITAYLYIELDGSTVQGGYSTVAPKTQTIAPTHSAGLDWINYNTGEVYNSNGSAWTKKYRVYVGTVVTDASKVVSSNCFSYSQNYISVWGLPWTEKFVINNPADTYVSPSLPLTRRGTMLTTDFYCVGTPASSTNIVVKQGGTTVGTAAISAAGKTTLTFSTAVTGALDDLFTYTVGGSGLSDCTVLCNQKWVNR